MTKVLILDAGHGLNTYGKRTPDDIREWTLNDEVCDKIKRYLEPYDIRVVRADDPTGKTDVPLKDRKYIAVREKADMYLAIHHNASGDEFTNVSGVETFWRVEKWKPLGQMLVDEMALQTGLRNRGTHYGKFLVINSQTIPSILCEGGFMNGTYDSYYIRSDKGTSDYARAVANVVVRYLKLDFKGTSPKPAGQLYRVRKTWADANSQIGAFSDLENAIALANRHPGYKVFDATGNPVYPTVNARGKRVVLKNDPLYVSATADQPSTYVSGVYYLADGVEVNGRYRITNNPELIGVTGWVNARDI